EITSPLSAGTNALLKLGAAPLTCAADLGIEPAAPAAGSPLLGLLPATADELVRLTGRDAADISRELVELELAGRVVARDGVYRGSA
ncbi:MAG: hypothetical protein KGI93_08825, partial [Acidobacteriota bacterium]|nr:hypothetical protein [Acidobacteriota bacterium]